ncbi:hypothetical protein TDB9533_02046 [Thalassocella blandensis]|nr:hypothetical protein TDB9533_02046 [Thalassocella blandensis]
MNHCILAMKENNDYLSVLCIYEGHISTMLQQHYNSEDKARSLVELGDINSIQEDEVNAFHRDWGISWRYTKPQHYSDKSSLLQYCEATGLDLMFLFDGQKWEKVEFEQNFEISDFELSDDMTMASGNDIDFDIDIEHHFEIESMSQFHRTGTH